MKKVNIAYLKNNLSAILSSLSRTGPIVVYDRTTPVAVLQPGPRATTSDDRLIRLEKMGIVRRGKKHVSLDLLSESPPRPKREINAAALISEEREGR